MKAQLKQTAIHMLTLALLFVAAYLFAGCTSPKKVRDIELKGMYVNGYSEVVAIGAGRLTSIPGEREALAAHYEEDTAWLSPSTKTHKFDIFLVGTNSVENSTEIISSICKAFSDVAPQVAATHAAIALDNGTIRANAGGTSAFDVVKGGGEVRKAVELAKTASEKVESKVGVGESSTGNNTTASQTSQQSQTSQSDCPDGNCTTGDCTDGNCSYNSEAK